MRHDESTLTLTPARGHGRTRVRLAEIERLEADAAPLLASRHASTGWTVLGGVAGWGLTSWVIGASSGNTGTGAIVGLVGVLPGAVLGGLAGGLFGGAAATLTREHSWIELPRSNWAPPAHAPVTSAAPDRARR